MGCASTVLFPQPRRSSSPLSPQHSQLPRLSPTPATLRRPLLSMGSLQASSSPAPSPLSTSTGDLLALLPFAYTAEPSSPGSPNSSVYGQRLDSPSPSDTTFSEKGPKLVHCYDTAGMSLQIHFLSKPSSHELKPHRIRRWPVPTPTRAARYHHRPRTRHLRRIR